MLWPVSDELDEPDHKLELSEPLQPLQPWGLLGSLYKFVLSKEAITI